MSIKKVWNTFLGRVLKEMEEEAGKYDWSKKIEWKKTGIKWKKMGVVGGAGLGKFQWREMAATGAVEVSKVLEPAVVKEGEEKRCTTVATGRFIHQFWVEDERYRYLRKNGKVEEKFKDFSSLQIEAYKYQWRLLQNKRERERVKLRNVEEAVIIEGFKPSDKMKLKGRKEKKNPPEKTEAIPPEKTETILPEETETIPPEETETIPPEKTETTPPETIPPETQTPETPEK